MNDICRVCESVEIYANLIANSNKIILKKLKACADIQVSLLGVFVYKILVGGLKTNFLYFFFAV